MALTLTRLGALNMLKAYFDGMAEPASLSIYLYTAGTPVVTMSTITGFTEAAGYTRPVISTTSADLTMSVALGNAGGPSNMFTNQLTITFSQATASIIGYLLLAGTDVIAWDTLTPVASQGNGDTLKLTITAFNLS
jgi:hypothetical protein